MIRTQIQLTEDQAQALKELSAKTGLSIAELVRRGLAPLLRDGLSAELLAPALSWGRFLTGTEGYPTCNAIRSSAH